MRFPRMTEDDMSPAQRTVAAAIAAGPRGELRGPFVPLIHSPELTSRVQALGEYVRFGSELPADLLEIAVLLVARHFDCPNIWVSHSRLAKAAGVSGDVIAAIAASLRPGQLTPDQTVVVDFCAQMLADNKVAAPAFDAALQRWGRKGVMDLAGACGYYTMLAMVLNVAEPPLPAGAVPFEA